MLISVCYYASLHVIAKNLIHCFTTPVKLVTYKLEAKGKAIQQMMEITYLGTSITSNKTQKDERSGYKKNI